MSSRLKFAFVPGVALESMVSAPFDTVTFLTVVHSNIPTRTNSTPINIQRAIWRLGTYAIPYRNKFSALLFSSYAESKAVFIKMYPSEVATSMYGSLKSRLGYKCLIECIHTSRKGGKYKNSALIKIGIIARPSRENCRVSTRENRKGTTKDPVKNGIWKTAKNLHFLRRGWSLLVNL